ncbi:PRC-barrel domain-containing protein [Rhizobiaceae bacterium BDR2-2]|uniref:PRC-barrel domain-containing protein n=1 Tax=Ectorhizobium quercum TaxID=2965071 RepID=A0AAE3SWD2_9HYPH|nr:PRC-barrel domain-containing protein [Ectorhizobium quercum]MCX8996313.1 PRC-barrel domain-containing protein [Ectorhizobium quercum]MCX8998648.1 PRC-barrel domain-containing protein [Ectorhizobium quercum]
MSKTLKMMTTAILLGSAAAAPVAYAQMTPAPSQGAEDTSPSATPTQPGAVPDVMPSAPATPGDSAATTTETPGSYLTGQEPGQIAATSYIGQTVHNSADESIGKVTDLILDGDQRVVAAVIGVGGFLGIGEKNVAVPIDSIEAVRDPENGSLKLTTLETAETLQAAPEFKAVVTQ